MAYVPVPKDLNAVKTKYLFNLTKRQLICFGVGGRNGRRLALFHYQEASDFGSIEARRALRRMK